MFYVLFKFLDNLESNRPKSNKNFQTFPTLTLLKDSTFASLTPAKPEHDDPYKPKRIALMHTNLHLDRDLNPLDSF